MNRTLWSICPFPPCGENWISPTRKAKTATEWLCCMTEIELLFSTVLQLDNGSHKLFLKHGHTLVFPIAFNQVTFYSNLFSHLLEMHANFFPTPVSFIINVCIMRKLGTIPLMYRDKKVTPCSPLLRWYRNNFKATIMSKHSVITTKKKALVISSLTQSRTELSSPTCYSHLV